MHNCTSLPANDVLLLQGPASTSVIVLGIIGNAYCFRLLLKTSINTAMLVSLSGLVLWDMLLLLCALLHHSLWSTLHFSNISDERWDSWQVSLNSLHECAHITSTWMLIEVSAERFFAVTRPFQLIRSRRGKHRRQSYARVIGGLIKLPVLMTFIAFVLTLPCVFEYTLENCLDATGEVSRERVPTWLLLNPLYKLAYRTLLLSVLKTFGPFIIIALLSAYTVKGLRESMDNRAAILMEQGQDCLFFSDKDKTKSLQTISILLLGKFLILRCWPTALAIAGAFAGWEDQQDSLTPSISHLLLLLNSASNSFIFVVIKSHFETRRLHKIRMKQRQMVAAHAEQVLWIGKALAGDRLLLLHHDEETRETSTFIVPNI
ncbi:hypothetical protein PFISCL1PPCAC_26176 [Pristionchus fissidentatus]|uniref:G-protein coupled receptors family 1 profile domain-containing protein n=1 Tax=Pristionchus fissidentatus TaxID=1538716 RepID=A0AAV5WRT4_9BILA|nr:hypothetical protein PFISCL1PPCAC_26176 [Pristionchus fissidentatus]